MQTATQTASPQVHAVQPSGPGHCILLSGVRWETYELLLADMQDSHAAHFAYDRGVLEITAPSYEHDNLKHIITVLVGFLAEEMEIDIEGGGSTTFAVKTWQGVSSLINASTFNTPSGYAGRNRSILPKTPHLTLLSKSTSPARR